MMLTFALIGTAVLIGAGVAAFILLRKPAIAPNPRVVRIRRKDRPLRKPTRTHVGKRVDRP